MGCINSNLDYKNPHKNININVNYNSVNINVKSGENNKIINCNGLQNLGNTCYINAILQCLLRIEPLYYYFVNKHFLNDIDIEKFKNKENLTENIYDLFVTYFENNEKVLEINDLYEYFINNFPIIERGEQQDAHEFLIFLLDFLHQELNRANKVNINISNNNNKPMRLESKYEIGDEDLADLELIARNYWQKYLTADKSILVDIFQGQIKNTITCLSCNIVKNTFECIMYYSLSIPKDNNCTLKKCLKMFSKEEKMEKNDKYDCENCKEKTNSLKKTEFWKFPNIIIFQLKRFKLKKDKFSKINTMIDFPIKDLNLNDFSKGFQRSKPIYNLFAVVNHSGDLDYGHYYTYAQCEKDNNWYYFDDDNYGMIEDPSDIVTKDAYLLFYYKTTNKNIYKQTLSEPKDWPFSDKTINNTKKHTIIHDIGEKIDFKIFKKKLKLD